MKTYLAYISAVTFLVTACTNKSNSPEASAPNATSSAEALLARGKKIYLQNCIACHNPNPKIDGPVGPAIAGSSQELIKERLIHGAYPKDYKAKRTTHLMPPLPGLEAEIPALNSFLNN